MSSEKDERIVAVGRYMDVRQAEFALSVLEGHGIDGFIDVPYTSSMFPHYMLNDGGVAVLVRESDAGRATDLLHSEGAAAIGCYVCGAAVPDFYIAESSDTPESDGAAEFVFLNTERVGHIAVCGACVDAGKFGDLSSEEIKYLRQQVASTREDGDA